MMQAMNKPDTPASADQGDTPANDADIELVREAAALRIVNTLRDAASLEAIADFLIAKRQVGMARVVKRSAANLRQLVE
jgi:hypothetical protein